MGSTAKHPSREPKAPPRVNPWKKAFKRGSKHYYRGKSGKPILLRDDSGVTTGSGKGEGTTPPTPEEEALQRLIDAATMQRFGDTETVLRDEIAATNRQPAGIDQAYNHYRDTIGVLVGQQANSAKSASDAQAALTQGVVGQQAALGVESADRQKQAAALYGIDTGQGQAKAAELATNLGTVDGLAGQLAQQGISAANAASLAGLQGMQAAGEASRLAAHADNTLRRRKLEDTQRDLAGQKGAFRVQYASERQQADAELDLAYKELLGKERDAARDYDIALQTLGLRGDELAALTADRNADNRRDDKRLDLDERKFKEDIARNTADAEREGRELDARIQRWKDQSAHERRTAAKNGQVSAQLAGLTPAQAEKWSRRHYKVRGLARYMRELTANGQHGSSSDIRGLVRKLGGGTDEEVAMAYDLAYNRPGGVGQLSRTTRTMAKGYFPGGIVPPDFIGR